MKLLTFRLGDEKFCLKGDQLDELGAFDMNTVTLVPKQPDHVLGVMNLRGSIIPICDLRHAFGFDGRQFDGSTICIVVMAEVAGETKKIGFVVDRVDTVSDLDVEPLPPKKLTGYIAEKYLMGIATMDDQMLSVLDIDSIVNDKLNFNGGNL